MRRWQVPFSIMALGIIGFILGIVTVVMAPTMLLPAIALILVGAGEGLAGLVLMQAAKAPKK